MVFLLYLLLTVILVSCIYHAIIYVIVPSLSYMRAHKELVAAHMMLDIFVREIRTSTIKQWKLIEPHYIIWNNGRNDVGWRYLNHTLERIQGHYSKHGVWKKKTTSIVGTALQSVIFTMNYKKEKILSVSLNIVTRLLPQKAVYGYVAVR